MTTYITYFDDNQIDEYGLKSDEHTILFKGNDTSYEGESINYLNTFYCELCTMYYVYKNNLKDDYICFKQYRRPFEWEQYGRLPESNEVIVYDALPVKNVIRHYMGCHGKQRAFDFLNVLFAVCGKNSSVSKYFVTGTQLYTNNSMVIKWDDFCKMCKFVFGVLKHIDMFYGLDMNFDKYMKNAREMVKLKKDQKYQEHFMAYIGERLVSAYIACYMKPLVIPRLKDDMSIGGYKPYVHKEKFIK